FCALENATKRPRRGWITFFELRDTSPPGYDPGDVFKRRARLIVSAMWNKGSRLRAQFQKLFDPTLDHIQAAVPERRLGQVVAETPLHRLFGRLRARGLQQPLVSLGELAPQLPRQRVNAGRQQKAERVGEVIK